MFRRRGSSKVRLEPEICVLLRRPSRYPGDVLEGVVVVDFAAPTDVLTLVVRLSGEERAAIGGLIVTDKNPEARKTLYYEQFVTLRGVDHDALEQRRSLLGRRRTTVVAPESPHHKASSQANGAASPEVPSAESSLVDFTPSVINGALAGAVQQVPGTYSYPFKVTLPVSLPPSRELQRAREGTTVLRYRAVATMVLATGKTYTAEVPFKVEPLPVQVQRWYDLHSDEQHGVEVAEVDASVVDELQSVTGGAASPPSHRGLKARLMAPAGTTTTEAADKEREVTCQRRIRHQRQFPEHRLQAEEAEFLQRAGSSKKNSGGHDAPASPQAPQEVAAEEPGRSAARKPRTYRDRCAKEDAADNRSLNGRGDSESETTDDEVRAFEQQDEDGGTSSSSSREEEEEGATPPPGEPQSGDAAGTLAANARSDVEAAAAAKDKKRRKHRHGHSKADARGDGSALREEEVEQLAFTPPDAELAPMPAHLTKRPSADVPAGEESPSKKKADHHKRKSVDGGKAERESNSRSTKAHKHRSRFTPLPCCQEFAIGLRGGFLRSGKVKVKLSLRTPLISVGYGKVAVKLLIDNAEGSGTISRIKYSLITRCYIRTKTEVYNYHYDAVETLSDVSIAKGAIVAVPEVELPVPRSTPLTILTEGMGTMTFLNVRLYVGTALKTFSKSIETEVVLVSGQDLQNNSRRLLRWSCFFRRRANDDGRDITVRPPTVNLTEQNAKPRVMTAAEVVVGRPSLSGGETSSIAPSTTDRSVLLARNSRRMAKDAPSLDPRRLAAVLNYDEAIFVPPAGDDGPSAHIDPMSTLNPFAMPHANMTSSLPSVDHEGEAQLESEQK